MQECIHTPRYNLSGGCIAGLQAWTFGLGFPVGSAVIAALGFVLAAMWIDTIATELVSMLEYLGLLSGISHTVRPCACLTQSLQHLFYSRLPCHACCYLQNRLSFLCTLKTPVYSKAQTKQGIMCAEARNLKQTVYVCAGFGLDGACLGQLGGRYVH